MPAPSASVTMISVEQPVQQPLPALAAQPPRIRQMCLPPGSRVLQPRHKHGMV